MLKALGDQVDVADLVDPAAQVDGADSADSADGVAAFLACSTILPFRMTSS